MSGVTTSTVMRNFLVISDCFPHPDQASGDLRFLSGLLAKQHAVTLCGLDTAVQKNCLGDDVFARHRADLITQEISVEVSLPRLLRENSWDVVLFKFHHTAMRMLNEVRFRQLRAHLLVDSLNVHFRRFAAKAALNGEASDLLMADHSNNHGHAMRLFNNCRPL